MILFLIAIMSTSGCATNGVDLVEAGKVGLSIVPTTPYRVRSVHVYEEGERTVIAGTITDRKASGLMPSMGVVKIAVKDAEGDLLQELVARVTPSPVRNIKRRGGTRYGDSRFVVESDVKIPPGASVEASWGTRGPCCNAQ